MTMTPFTCDAFADHLASHLEHDDAPAVRGAMELHAAGCGKCAALLADVAAIRADASLLPTLTPSRDLWSGIESRIEAPVVSIGSGGRSHRVAGAARRPAWMRPALAAAALVGITAGVTHYATRAMLTAGASGPQVAVLQPAAPVIEGGGAVIQAPEQVIVQSPTPGVAPVATRSRSSAADEAPLPAEPSTRRPSAAQFVDYRQGDLAVLDSLYYREIIRLRQIVGERRTDLDSTTVGVLDRNLAVIDQAIRECRAALARDPASAYLNQQLNQALENKIELLRSAATGPVGS